MADHLVDPKWFAFNNSLWAISTVGAVKVIIGDVFTMLRRFHHHGLGAPLGLFSAVYEPCDGPAWLSSLFYTSTDDLLHLSASVGCTRFGALEEFLRMTQRQLQLYGVGSRLPVTIFFPA